MYTLKERNDYKHSPYTMYTLKERNDYKHSPYTMYTLKERNDYKDSPYTMYTLEERKAYAAWKNIGIGEQKYLLNDWGLNNGEIC